MATPTSKSKVKKRLGISHYTQSTESLGSLPSFLPSFPASRSSDHRTFSISSLSAIKERTWRPFASHKDKDKDKDKENRDHRDHKDLKDYKDHKRRDASHGSTSSIPASSRGNASSHSNHAASERSLNFLNHARKLSKPRPLSSSSHHDTPSRRGSTTSTADARSVVTALSTTASPIDWEAQHVEGFAPLLLKTKAPYMVVTTNYLVKTKSREDVMALFPGLAAGKSQNHQSTTSILLPEPLLVIPTDAIVSVFASDSSRSSFGFEVWWRNPLAGLALCRSDFCFGHLAERDEQLHHLARAMRANQAEHGGDFAYQFQHVKPMLDKVHDTEEPAFRRRRPDIFPVVPRGNTRKEHMAKMEDATKKCQEGPAFYLVLGTYLCHFVEIHKGKNGEAVCRHKTFGLTTLESVQGEWTVHDERLVVTFRDPFKPPVTLELASRHYRQMVRALGTADRFLKPAWPQLWQSMEVFQVAGLKEPQYLVPKEDFGSFKRTLDAYLAAYRCEDVDWEINWKTRFAPEFRLVPPKRGSYSPLQLLAVLRALRYNDYFTALSFRGVDLSVLSGARDGHSSHGKGSVAYLSRTCVALGPGEIEMLRASSLLHQEFHALAFCSETIRQVDFGSCAKPPASRPAPAAQQQQQQQQQHRGQPSPGLEFLAPILNLLRSGSTKCNRLVLSGNHLAQADVDDIGETMKAGALQALDVSSCGLDDASLRDMVITSLSDCPGQLRSLSVSGNQGRLPAHILPGLLQYLTEIRELNLSGSIQAENLERSLLPLAALERMDKLEELDISGYNLDEATFLDLERFLQRRSEKLARHEPVRFHKLVLNNCLITGAHAARLFHAIGPNPGGLHLSLSNNPLESNLDALTAAISANHGPSSLHLEMIEFKHLSNYLSLLSSLTPSVSLTRLSLLGTAPTPSGKPCPPALLSALSALLSTNTSLTHLDLSGYSGKLDDSHLPPGFGAALSALAHNATLTHLRLRNQHLFSSHTTNHHHNNSTGVLDAAGPLGRALAHNTTLRCLDCRDNNLGLTSLGFLAKSIGENKGSSLVEFPLPEAEREGIWRGVVAGLGQRGEGEVRGVLDGVFEGLAKGLRANRERVREEKGRREKVHRHKRSGSKGLGVLGEEGWGWMMVRGSVGEEEVIEEEEEEEEEGRGVEAAPPVLPELVAGGYRFGEGLEEGRRREVESPAATLGTVEEVETPVEEKPKDFLGVKGLDAQQQQQQQAPVLRLEQTGDDDDMLRKLLGDFERAGFGI